MKYKKGNPITCINDLLEYINCNECFYIEDEKIKSSHVRTYRFGFVLEQIENRNFYYAVEVD
jgi:hypothetical protein